MIAVARRRVVAAIGLFVAIAVLSSGPFADAGRPPNLHVAVADSTQSFAAIADAKVGSDAPLKNYGSAADLRVRNVAAGTNSWNSYLKFDLTGLGDMVASAVLRLYVTSGTNSGGGVYVVSDDWAEGTITWPNAPVISGTPLDTLGGVTTGTWVEWDVTGAVSGEGSLSLAIRNNGGSGTFSSREGVNPPQLEVTSGGPPPPPVAPVAEFSATPTSGNAPLTVSFTDASTNTPTAWAWDFDGDGSVDSTARSPVQTYTAAGTFSVTLTASNAAGSDPITKTNLVSVGSGGGGALPPEQEESGPFPKAGLLPVAASGRTSPVDPADDPAIWVHPTNPGLSVIIGSNKDDDGGLHVFDLSGVELQYVAGGQHNNVDVRYGFRLNGDLVDLVSVSDRNNDQIDIYTIDPNTRRLTQVGAIQAGITLYGYAMYHDRATNRFYGFVARDNVEQYEFVDIGGGQVGGVLVRAWSLDSMVEGIVADDELGVVYLGEESQGIFKYGADPGDPTNIRETVDLVGSPTQLVDDVEGLAIYYRADGLGYLIASSQGNNRYIVYRREGDNQYLGTFEVADGPFGPALDTDGIDVINVSLGPHYPLGMFVAQNDDADFKMVAWEDIASALGLAIHSTGYDVRDDRDDACLDATSVSVVPGTSTIEVGTSVQLTAVPRDAGGQPVDCAVSWSSSSIAVATVGTTGLVTGVGAGQTASILASSGSATGTAAVTVTASSNSAPAVDAGANLASQEGSSVAIQATFSDADSADLHTATINWGDGSPPQAVTVVQAAGTIAGSHVYANDGAFAVAVTVNDGRGGVASDTTQANIGNVPPTASAGGPYSGIAGVAIPFSGSAIDPGADVLTYQWDFDYDGVAFDAEATGRFPQHAYASAGTYTAALRVGDDDAVSIATAQVVVAVQPQAVLYLAVESGATLGGLNVTNEDIVAFGGTGFSLLLDGSDVGLGSAAIDAFSVVGPSEILLSFTGSRSIAGVSGTVDDSDIVRFTATSLEPTTAGTFSMYFDASDVGLTTSGEDVDAAELLPDGRLVMSTEGSFSVPGVSGADADAVVFTPTSLGPSTAGNWAMYFDGSDVGLTTSDEDIDAVAIDASGRVHLSTRGGFSVAGASGADEDVFVFMPTQLGSTTAGTFSSSLFFDGSARGVSGDIAAVDLP